MRTLQCPTTWPKALASALTFFPSLEPQWLRYRFSELNIRPSHLLRDSPASAVLFSFRIFNFALPANQFLFSSFNTCSLICSAFRGLSQFWIPINSFICSLHQLQILRCVFYLHCHHLLPLVELVKRRPISWTSPTHHHHHTLKVLLASLLSNATGNF